MVKLLRLIQELKYDALKRSMLLSTLCKPLGLLISFLYTPVLLAYLGEESYGIWSTILSIISWINYFDIGIGLGLRNSLTKYIAIDDRNKVQKLISTGYVAITVISGVTLMAGTVFIFNANIGMIFNTRIDVRSALLVSFWCICINFTLSLSKIQLYAIQQAEKVSLMIVLTQLINLFGVLVLYTFSRNCLMGVAVIIGLSGIIVNLFFLKKVWREYPFLVPSANLFSRNELKEISNLGLKFFFIQMAALVLYSTDNLIVIRLFGPSCVTPYHTSYTAFGIVYGVFGAMISPLWSKYTVAVQRKDYQWISKTITNLDRTLPLIGIVLIAGTFTFTSISEVWLHKKLDYETGLIACMATYYFLSVWGSIYSTVLNGMSRVNMQLSLGIGAAILNIPLSLFLGRNCKMGSTGVCLATVICMLIMNIPITVDTHRYLNKMRKYSENI